MGRREEIERWNNAKPIPECSNCGDVMEDSKFKCCTTCREKWRKQKSEIKEFWVILLRRKDGLIESHIHGHNAIGDYRGLPNFIGMKHIKINMENLQK